MSPTNLSSKIYEMGEVNYDRCTEGFNSKTESTVIAKDILSEILENAMDIAINKSPGKIESKKMNIIDDIQDELIENCPEIKDIIEGLSKINVNNLKNPTPEQPANIDAEMKRLLTEMMAPPFEIVNYEQLPRKDGVGDQPVNINAAEQENSEIITQPSKPVEKKSRVTDLVMNSKKVLSNLLDEEERKRLEEWEENNEHIIQVIELQSKKCEQKSKQETPESSTPKIREEEEPDLIQKPNEEAMDNVDLNTSQQDTKNLGEGDDINKETTAQADDHILNKSKSSLSQTKKKKWSFNFKFFGFKKNRKAQALDNEAK